MTKPNRYDTIRDEPEMQQDDAIYSVVAKAVVWDHCDPEILIKCGHAQEPGRLYPIQLVDTVMALLVINRGRDRVTRGDPQVHHRVAKQENEDFAVQHGKSVSIFMIRMADHLVFSHTIDEQAHLMRLAALFVGRS